MNESPFGHASGHARHDRLLVVRFAAGDALASETDDARRLVEQCADCASLAADIQVLRTSMATLPTPRRTRNFRISAEQAEQLRGSAFDRFLRRLSMPGMGMLRPVAGVALAVGLTITVVGAGLPSTYLSPVNAPSEVDRLMLESAQPPQAAGSERDPTFDAAAATPAVPAPAASGEAVGLTGSPFGASDSSGGRADASAAPTATKAAVAAPPNQPAQPTRTTVDTSTDTTRLLLIYAGVTLAMVSFAVLLLGIFARRRNEDPLLR